MKALRLALLQIMPTGSLDGNLEKGMTYCKKAKALGADVVLFPEMWSNGYDIYTRSPEIWMKEAISVESEFINSFKHLAKELEMAIGITFLETWENGPRNSVVLFDRHG